MDIKDEGTRMTRREIAEMSMELYPIGASVDYHASCWDAQYRVACAVDRMVNGNSSRWLSKAEDSDEQFYNVPVYQFQGKSGVWYPFFLMPDYYATDRLCLMSPFDTNYSYNSRVAKDLEYLGYTDKVTEIPVVHRKDVQHIIDAAAGDRETLLRSYIKDSVSNNVVPHFLGEKSKKVEWRTRTAYYERTPIDELEAYGAHTKRVTLKANEFTNPYSILDQAMMGNLANAWEFSNWQDKEAIGYYVEAVDLENKGYVPCRMFISKGIDGFNARKIFVDTAPQYKPYSLVLNAHVATIFGFLLAGNETINHIDLGCNFNDSGDYKSVIKHTKESLLNFPTFANHQEFEDWRRNWTAAGEIVT